MQLTLFPVLPSDRQGPWRAIWALAQPGLAHWNVPRLPVGGVAAEDAGTPDSHISKLVGVRGDHVQGLAPAHRQAGEGPVVLARDNAVVLLHERNDVLQQLVGEPILERLPRGPDLRSRGGAGGVWGKLAGRGRLPLGMTTSIGLAFLSARRLSRMKPARPVVLQPESSSPAPWSRYTASMHSSGPAMATRLRSWPEIFQNAGMWRVYSKETEPDQWITRQRPGEPDRDPLDDAKLAPRSANGSISSLIAWATSRSPGNGATVSIKKEKGRWRMPAAKWRMSDGG